MERQKWVYLKLTGKLALFQLPKQLLIGGGLVLVMLCVALVGQNALYGEGIYEKQTVAVVLEADSMMTKMAMQYVQKMDSVNTACRFKTMEKEKAVKALEEGEIIACMLVPEAVLEDILSGKNTPVQVMFRAGSSFEKEVIRQLTQAGAELLGIAQAQIYAVYDIALEKNALEQLGMLEQDINEWNLAIALEREHFFETKEITVLGKVSMASFYYASAGLLLLFLWGISASFMRQAGDSSCAKMLERSGTGIVWQKLCQLLVEALFLFVLQCGYFLMIRLLSDVDSTIRFMEFLLVQLITAIFISCMHLFAYSGWKEQGMTTSVLVISSVLMLFLSGGFIPHAFLPEKIEEIAKILPSTWLLELQSVLLESGSVENVSQGMSCGMVLTIGWAVALFGAAVVISYSRAGKGIVSSDL